MHDPCDLLSALEINGTGSCGPDALPLSPKQHCQSTYVNDTKARYTLTRVYGLLTHLRTVLTAHKHGQCVPSLSKTSHFSITNGQSNLTIRLHQGEGVVPGEYFFSFYKNRHILQSDSANYTVLRAVVLRQHRRVTDRQTDGRNCRS